MGFENADGGAVWLAGPAQDRISAGLLNRGDDGRGGGGPGDGNQLTREIGGYVGNAWEA